MRTIISAAIAIIIHLVIFYGVFRPANSSNQLPTVIPSTKYSTIDLTSFNTRSIKPKANPSIKTFSQTVGSTSSSGAETSTSAIVNASSEGAKSLFEFFVEPEYPKLARLKGIEGKVKVKVEFDVNGKPIHILILESSKELILDESVKKAASKWKAAKNNSSFEKTFVFKLKD